MRKILITSLSLLLICAAVQAYALSAAVQAVCGSSAAASSCSVDYTNDAETTNTNPVSYRIVIPANTTACSGTEIRITLEAHSTSDSIFSGTSVGIRSSTTEDTTTAPTRITWATGNNGVTVSAGTTAASDWVSYTWTKTDVHIIHIYMADNGTQYIRRKSSATETTYYTTDAAQSDTTVVADFTPAGTTANRPFLFKIEVR